MTDPDRDGLGERIRILRERARGRRRNPAEDAEALERDEFEAFAGLLTIAELTAWRAMLEAVADRDAAPADAPAMQLFRPAPDGGWIGTLTPLAAGVAVVRLDREFEGGAVRAVAPPSRTGQGPGDDA